MGGTKKTANVCACHRHCQGNNWILFITFFFSSFFKIWCSDFNYDYDNSVVWRQHRIWLVIIWEFFMFDQEIMGRIIICSSFVFASLFTIVVVPFISFFARVFENIYDRLLTCDVMSDPPFQRWILFFKLFNFLKKIIFSNIFEIHCVNVTFLIKRLTRGICL